MTELRDNSGSFGAEQIGEKAHRHPQQRAGQNRDSDKRELLVDGKFHIAHDEDDQRTERDPSHEAYVEIEEGREQRGPVTSLLEFSKLHRAASNIGAWPQPSGG